MKKTRDADEALLKKIKSSGNVQETVKELICAYCYSLKTSIPVLNQTQHICDNYFSLVKLVPLRSFQLTFLIGPVEDILANYLVGTVIPVEANLAASRRWSSLSR